MFHIIINVQIDILISKKPVAANIITFIYDVTIQY